MSALQDQYDEAMYAFTTANYAEAIAKLQALLGQAPEHFDAQLALGMAFYRQGDYARAIEEGHKAEQLRPQEQLVHTNLSLFYMKAGNRAVAEHHGLQARLASWRAEAQQAKAGATAPSNPELEMAKPKSATMKMPEKFPDMPWKKKHQTPNSKHQSETPNTKLQAPGAAEAAQEQPAPNSDLPQKS
jgi:tetratricopeptide (TPR) repeat protein